MHSDIRHVVTVVRDGDAGQRRGHAPGAGRHRAPRRRLDRSRRRPAAGGQQPRMRRVDPHRRVGPGVEVARPGERRRRARPICRRACSWAPSCTRARPTPWSSPPGASPSSDGSPSDSASGIPRPSSSWASPASRGCWPEVGGVLSVTIFVVNVAAGPAGDRGGAVLAGGRGRHHPAAASRRRVDEPGHRLAAARRRRRSSSSGWCASRTSATSTCCSPTRPALSPTVTSASNGRSTRLATTAPRCSRSGSSATKPAVTGDTAVGGNPLDIALWEAPGATSIPIDRLPPGRHRPVRSRSPLRLGAGRPRRRAAAHHQGRPRGGAGDAASTSPTGRAGCSSASSPPATVWWPSPPGPPPP